MIGPDNWIMVTCSTPGCETPKWLMHWPCEGSEEFIRKGPHICAACTMKAHFDRAIADPVTHYPALRVSSVTIQKDRLATVQKIENKPTGEEANGKA